MRSRVNVPGAAIAYRLDGEREAPTVMLAHALAADMGMWDDNVGALSSAYRVLRYDMRGHGSSSSPPASYTAARLADDAVALLDALEIERVHFVGVCLGAVVALQLEARYPNRVRTLALFGMASVRCDPAALEADIAAVRARGIEEIVEPTVRRWFTPGFVTDHPGAAEKAREMIRRTRINGFVGCAGALLGGTRAPMTSKVPGAPVAVLTGSEDRPSTGEDARPPPSLIAGREILVVPRTAGMPNLERPSAFGEALLEFLSRHAGGGSDGRSRDRHRRRAGSVNTRPEGA